MEPVLNDESVNTTVTQSHLNQSSRLLLIFSELSKEVNKEVTSLTENLKHQNLKAHQIKLAH